MSKRQVEAWFKNDELFRKELEKGHAWQLFVAERLRDMGVEEVEVPDMGPHEGHKAAFKYANSKDIIANGLTIEVKSRNYPFSSHLDFPFETIAVDTKMSFDQKTDKPVIYICVSQQTSAMCALDVEKTRKDWVIARRFDTVRRIPVVSYDCHRDLWETVEDVVDRLIKKTGDASRSA